MSIHALRRNLDEKGSIEEWKAALNDLPLDSTYQITTGNQIRLLIGGEQILPALVRFIDSATQTLSFQFLNMEADVGGRPVAEALIRAAKRGVEVQGVLDGVSTWLELNGELSFWPMKLGRRKNLVKEKTETKKMFKDMKTAGVHFEIDYPSRSNRFTRNHRKSVVADNRRLWIGGFNPTEHNYHWREVCAWIEGPCAIEAQKLTNSAFAQARLKAMSYEFTGFDSRFLGQNECTVAIAINEPREKIFMRELFLEVVDRTRRIFRVENSYFSDGLCMNSLIAAAKRGVQVQLIVPQKSNYATVDWIRNNYFRLLAKAGVEVYLYPGMIHAKVFCADDVLVSIGSCNFSPMNLAIEKEFNILAIDDSARLAKELVRNFFEVDMAKSQRVFL